MPRLPHGKVITTDDLANARGRSAARAAGPLDFVLATPPDLQDFDYLFPTLQVDPDALLPESPETVRSLKKLAAAMTDTDQVGQDTDSRVPAAYTYFGQFVDHDITLEVSSGAATEDTGQLLSPDLVPLGLDEVRSTIRNARTGTLDLDSVYGGTDVPRHPTDPAKLRVGRVTQLGNQPPPSARPAGKGIDNDVPREPISTDPSLDRAARIGDPRNDENTIISQLHVAFLKAHNRLVDEGHDLEQARRILRQHYQHVVVHDFLRRVADPDVVDDVLTNGNRWYNALAEPFFLPLEFSAAAYRFGHTMVRADYDFNLNFHTGPDAPGGPASLELLFVFTALSGQLGFSGGDTLPENWIVEWERLIGDDVGPGGRARRFDTRLSAMRGDARAALFALQTVDGQPEQGLAAFLAARNLLRGYRLRMPTGQAVARVLGLPVLTEQEIRDAVGELQAAELEDGGFLDRTPLWYYVLAEAAAGGGEHLGKVGSTIVAEVLVGLVRRSDDSILRTPGWTVSLPAREPGRFELADLLRFAGVLPGGAPTRIHVVAAGETLSGIAEAQLGDASRWPEIFAANRAVVRRFDQITPGMRLILPTGEAPVPQLRFHLVERGDTLSSIAQKQLGDAARWREIFTLNGEVLTNPDVVVVGQVLQLPGL